MLLRDAHQDGIKSFTLAVGGLANVGVKLSLTVLLVIADVVEELFKFNIVKVLFFAELACHKDAPKGLHKIVAHIDDRLASHELFSLPFDDSEGACNTLDLLTAFKEPHQEHSRNASVFCLFSKFLFREPA